MQVRCTGSEYLLPGLEMLLVIWEKMVSGHLPTVLLGGMWKEWVSSGASL